MTEDIIYYAPFYLNYLTINTVGTGVYLKAKLRAFVHKSVFFVEYK